MSLIIRRNVVVKCHRGLLTRNICYFYYLNLEHTTYIYTETFACIIALSSDMRNRELIRTFSSLSRASIEYKPLTSARRHTRVHTRMRSMLLDVRKYALRTHTLSETIQRSYYTRLLIVSQDMQKKIAVLLCHRPYDIDCGQAFSLLRPRWAIMSENSFSHRAAIMRITLAVSLYRNRNFAPIFDTSIFSHLWILEYFDRFTL